MKSARSKLSRSGLVTSGLALCLGGCPQDAGDGGANGSGLSSLANPVNGGGASTLDRSAIVRPNSPTLFVADPNIGVMSFASANVLNGNVAPTTFIDSFERFRSTNDQVPMTASAVCVDRVGVLVVNDAAPSLRFYDKAASVSGIPAPNREIGGAGSRLIDNGGVAYDRGNDRLFVASKDSVLIFEGASLSQTGQTPPTRFFTSTDLPGGGSIALGPNGDLYVVDLLNRNVLVFADAGARSGAIRADRVIEPPIIADVVFVDSSDRLYVASSDKIVVADGAQTLSGPLGTVRQMQLAGVQAINETGSAQPEIETLVVDSRGIGYVADRANAAIHVFDSIGTRSGGVRADRAIHGPAVEFERPFAIFLWE